MKKTNFLIDVEENFKFSLDNYKKHFQSNHWLFNNNKKKKLFTKENLHNFRSNGLSDGMDDKFYTKEQAKKFFSELLNTCGKKFLYNLLLKKNIGKSNRSLKKSPYYYTAHELFHIKFIHEIKNFVKINKKDIICEIGPAYGSMISKLIKVYNSKVILIDLPEANFLSHYYLKKIFPKKKFFVSSNIKNKSITKKDILKNDIIIICPWDKLPKISIKLFINARSMMEMNYETIDKYFNLIQNFIYKNGYFLCINRYYKDTVGYPIEMNKYPFDDRWKVLISKASWKQDHIHFLLTQRVNRLHNSIRSELNIIKKLSEKVRKKDKFLIRRILPNFIYIIYKKTKFFLFSK